jgi:hypothetical protein
VSATSNFGSPVERILRYSVEPPQVQVSPLITFPDQLVGTQGPPVAIPITNIGYGPLSIPGFSGPPGDFVFQGTSCSGILQPGDTCFASVTFNPSATGLRSGTIGVLINGPQPTISLIGKGIAAGPCAGFDDVAASSLFCSSVAFIRNRSVTVGCVDGATFCPNDGVTRLSMAAFLSRLANAVTPAYALTEQSLAYVAANDVICHVAAESKPYSRTVVTDGVIDVFLGLFGFGGMAVRPVGSLDDGISWIPLADARIIVTSGSGGTSTISGPLHVPGGVTALVGLQLVTPQGSGNPAPLVDSVSCKLRATVTSSSAP